MSGIRPNRERLSWEQASRVFDDPVLPQARRSNDPMTEDLVAVARAWRPDLALWGAKAFAGAVAAEAVGAVHARVLYSVGVHTRMRTDFLHAKALQPPEQRTDAMRDWPADWAGRYGVEFSEDLVDGRFTLAPLPEAFRPHAWPVTGITVLVRCDRGHRAGLEKTSAQRLITTETAGPAR